MKNKIFAVTMAVVLLGAGVAFAGPYHHMGQGGWGPGGMGPGGMGQGGMGMWQGADRNWMEQAPQNVKDAFKQMDVNRSEMRLEIAKGNTDSQKLAPLHNNMLKARRVIADYFFDQALKNPGQASRYMMGGRHQGMGMQMMGGGVGGALFSDLRSELSKANPDTARAKQIYGDMMNLSEKQSKERFELMQKYPESMNTRHRGCIF